MEVMRKVDAWNGGGFERGKRWRDGSDRGDISILIKAFFSSRRFLMTKILTFVVPRSGSPSVMSKPISESRSQAKLSCPPSLPKKPQVTRPNGQFSVVLSPGPEGDDRIGNGTRKLFHGYYSLLLVAKRTD